MPSNASAREIYYHPNAAAYFLVHGLFRRRFVDPGGVPINNQMAEHINQGAIDRRPGAPGQLLGNDAVEFLEALEEV